MQHTDCSVGLFEACGEDCAHCRALQSALFGLLEARKLSRGSKVSGSVTTAGDDSSTDSSSCESDLTSNEPFCPKIAPTDDVVAPALEAFCVPASVPTAKERPHAALQAAWAAAEETGLLRYRLAGGMAAQERCLGGEFGLVAQFVPGRASKRPPAVTTVDRVDVPFDVDAFHFGKIAPAEILGYLVPGQDGPRWSTRPEADAARVLLNVSPVCRGHFLLVGGQQADKPQVLGEGLLTLALQFQQADASGEWHLSFNSMGGGASVNNEHWQGFTGPVPVLGRARTTRRHGDTTLAVVRDWPLPVVGVSGPLASVVREVLAFVAALRARNLAYNVLIAESQAWVFPRALCNPYGAGGDVSRLQIAAHEASGVLIVPSGADFDSLTAEGAEALLRSARANPAEVAQALRKAGWPEDLW